MRSDTIVIDNSGYGFGEAIDHTTKVAAYKELERKDALHLQMLTEELLSLARSVAGATKASFWIEFENGQADLHMTTKTVLDREQRDQLISAASSRTNEASKTFLGWLRNRYEEAMVTEPEHYTPSNDLLNDLPFGIFEEPEWDGYERSILKKLADDVKVGIRGDNVEIIVSKRFDR